MYSCNQKNYPPAFSTCLHRQYHKSQLLHECPVSNLKRRKPAGPHSLPHEIFKDGGRKFLLKATEVLGSVWQSEAVPSNWFNPLIIPVYKKEDKSSFDNQRRISLTNTVSKILGFIVIRRLTAARENQASSRH
ncbi:unnamed protein product [Heterobilharzia americana]|nr:unnamed protein product [Heterobilharzia americana]